MIRNVKYVRLIVLRNKRTHGDHVYYCNLDIYLRNFETYVASDAINPLHSVDKQLCGRYEGLVDGGATVDIPCGGPIFGRFEIKIN